MKKFLMTSNVEFKADNIIDAFKKLSEHFAYLADNENNIDPKLFTFGKIKINTIDIIYKYYLKESFDNKKWNEVSKEEWIKAEREAGIRPKLSSDHPDYMTTCATSGFNGNGISGKIEWKNDENWNFKESI